MPTQQPNAHGQYSYLQGAGNSTNATPSPTMANQMRPSSVPQRVATASPHAFSPGGPPFGGQGTPLSEQETPQPNQFAAQDMALGFTPVFNPSPSPGAQGNMMGQQHMVQQMPQIGQGPNGPYPPGPPPALSPAMQRTMSLDQQKAYQLRMQHMQTQFGPQQHGTGQGRGMVPKQPMPPDGQQAAPPGSMPPGMMMRAPGPQARNDAAAFMRHLATFMNSRGIPFDPNPVIADRPVNVMALFQQVQARGGCNHVSLNNAWVSIAMSLGFDPNHFPMAPRILRAYFEQNLFRFEEAVTLQRQQRQPNVPPGQQSMQQSMQQPPAATPQAMLPQAMPPQAMPPQSHMGPIHMQPVQHMVPGQLHATGRPGQPPSQTLSHHGVNGFSGLHHPGAMAGPAPGPATPGHPQRRESMGMQFTTPAGATPVASSFAMTQHPAPKLSHHTNFRTEHYTPIKVTNRDSYGHVGEFDRTFRDAGLVAAMRPDVPSLRYLGNINIHALTKSIQSGIHSEVRVALDTLATVSRSEIPSIFLYISACEELLESLIECAEEQLDVLAENTPEVSDEVQLSSYEDIIRACQVDMLALRKDPPFGSVEYVLDRTVERLLCIMTILRNLSFPPENVAMHVHIEQMRVANQTPPGIHPLGDEAVTKLLCDIVRYLGTRTMFLRTSLNTLDFMKDLVTILSNISGYMEVPSREQAMCLLQFLLAFAPTPAPLASSLESVDDGVIFVPYDPVLHPYLPAAVDSLAQLLARDDPNRSLYSTIFTLEASGSTPYDLLTRAFALAISPIPDLAKGSNRTQLPSACIDVRMPLIMQGLLAGDILASLAPGHEVGLTRAWIASPSGFAQNLNRLIGELMTMFEMRPRHASRNISRQEQEVPETLLMIRRALAMQQSLITKARDVNDPTGSLPPGVALSQSLALRALDLKPDMWVKEGVLSLLLSCIQLDS